MKKFGESSEKHVTQWSACWCAWTWWGWTSYGFQSTKMEIHDDKAINTSCIIWLREAASLPDATDGIDDTDEADTT